MTAERRNYDRFLELARAPLDHGTFVQYARGKGFGEEILRREILSKNGGLSWFVLGFEKDPPQMFNPHTSWMQGGLEKADDVWYFKENLSRLYSLSPKDVIIPVPSERSDDLKVLLSRLEKSEDRFL